MKLEKMSARIHQKLVKAFAPIMLEISDDIPKHEGHVGYRVAGETHFKIRLISEMFVGKTLIARHRAVYAALEEDMKEGGIHALALETLAPDDKFNVKVQPCFFIQVYCSVKQMRCAYSKSTMHVTLCLP